LIELGNARLRDNLVPTVALLALWFVAFVAAAQPSTRLPRIGYVMPTASTWAEAKLSPTVQGLVAGMRDHGYVEGRDYVVEVRSAYGDPERFADLTAELVRLDVDVVYVPVCGAPLNAALKATATVPIVVATCNDDLVETGTVKSLRHPGGNVTGLSKLTPELAPKRLSLLKQAVPSIARVAVLWNPDYSDFKADWRELRAAAERLGITLHSFEFRRADELELAFHAIRRAHVDALITFSDLLTYVHASRLAELAASARLPAMYAFREIPDAGGLMSYGPNIADMWRQSADYVVRILKGGSPGDMAIEQPRRFELVVNLKAARALGVSIPQPLLLQADDVIR
jgi:putative ABC transport system substrate-binding protein